MKQFTPEEIAERYRQLTPRDSDPFVPDGMAGREAKYHRIIVSDKITSYVQVQCELCPHMDRVELCTKNCAQVRAEQESLDKVKVT